MAGTLYVDIVTPKGSVFQGDAAGLQAPGVNGMFTVLHDHAPMIAAFEVGILSLKTPQGEEFVFATSGGFLEVLNNTVTVLAETAEAPSDIDLERAKAAEQRALARLQESGADRTALQEELERARNRARVAMGQVGTRS